MSRFFTTKGDNGTTGLIGSQRISKADPLIDALGTLDEANSSLGMARAQARLTLTREILLHVQRDMYRLMSGVASTHQEQIPAAPITAGDVAWIEEQIHSIGKSASFPKGFIVPGDTIPEAALDMARTVVRRSERRIAGLIAAGQLSNPQILSYLNRLSSLCFALELLENQSAGIDLPTPANP